MAATIEIVESNGNPAVNTTVSSLPFGSVDSANLVPTSHPIAAGANSFEKWIRAKITSISSDLTIIDNFKVYLSSIGSGWKSGESIKCNLTESEKKYSAAAYPATGPVSSTSSVATRDMPEEEPTQSNIGINGSLDTEVPLASTFPVYTDYIVLQLQTNTSTPSGNVASKVLVVQWDER